MPDEGFSSLPRSPRIGVSSGGLPHLPGHVAAHHIGVGDEALREPPAAAATATEGAGRHRAAGSLVRRLAAGATDHGATAQVVLAVGAGTVCCL